MTNFKKNAFYLVFVLLLCLIQIYLLPKIFPFFVKPNLALIGLSGLISFFNFKVILSASALSGLIYGWNEISIFPNLLSFILFGLIIYWLSKKFFSANNFLSAFAFGFLGTILFNLIYLGINYLIFSNNLFHYFFSSAHLYEILLNGLLSSALFGIFWFFERIKK